MKSYSYNLGFRLNKVAKEFGDKIALYYPGSISYTFRELESKSNQYSYHLEDLGLESGDVIAILNNKSFDALCLMLGAIKIGVIYTNLDPDSPKERLGKMLDTCNPNIIFIDDIGREFIEDNKFPYPSKRISNESSKLAGFDNKPHSKQNLVTGACAAYIMFTSGSTGFPKGAVMSHNNLLNLVDWAKDTFNITSNDRFTSVNPIYFDNSVFDFYGSIFNGASIVPFSIENTKNPKDLVRLIDETNCTNWFSVPSMLIYLLTTKALRKDNFKSIKKIVFGGEGFSKNQLKKLYQFFGETKEFFNVYGPTECTCICSSYQISSDDFQDLSSFAPLGKIAPNFEYYIDSNGSNLNEGELCLLGPNVGLGYFNDLERTSNSFIQHPERKYHSIMYKTGDLVYLDNDGLLQIKGRVDNQIKHMGYRIELEEVESGMNQLNGVKESAAVYKELGNGIGYIVGFLAVEEGLEYKMFKEELLAILPSYMIPREIIQMKILPKNQNGKIDRNQLKNSL